MDQPGKVLSAARGQLNRENIFSLFPFAPKNSVSRDGLGPPVPRQPAHLHTLGEFGAYSRNSSRFPRRRLSLYRQPPWGQSRVYQVTLLRTDGVHCRVSAGTEPVVLKVIFRVTGADFSGITMDQFFCASLFPHPLLYWYIVDMCDTEIM